MNKFTLLTAGALASMFVSGSVMADEVSSNDSPEVVQLQQKLVTKPLLVCQLLRILLSLVSRLYQL